MKRLMAIIITFALCVTIASYTNKKADELITNNTSAYKGCTSDSKADSKTDTSGNEGTHSSSQAAGGNPTKNNYRL